MDKLRYPPSFLLYHYPIQTPSVVICIYKLHRYRLATPSVYALKYNLPIPSPIQTLLYSKACTLSNWNVTRGKLLLIPSCNGNFAFIFCVFKICATTWNLDPKA